MAIDYYVVLGVSRGANLTKIKQAGGFLFPVVR